MLPWQFGAVTNTMDIILTAQTGKSSSEHIASKVTQLDCQWLRIFYNWNFCLSHEEYVDNLITMDCDIYSWNFFNMPYCKVS